MRSTGLLVLSHGSLQGCAPNALEPAGGRLRSPGCAQTTSSAESDDPQGSSQELENLTQLQVIPLNNYVRQKPVFLMGA